MGIDREIEYAIKCNGDWDYLEELNNALEARLDELTEKLNELIDTVQAMLRGDYDEG